MTVRIRIALIAIVSVVVLALTGLASAAVITATNSPGAQLASAGQNMTQAGSAHIEADVPVAAEDGQVQTLHMSGTMNFADEAFDGTVSGNMNGTNMSVPVIIVDDSSYYNVNGQWHKEPTDTSEADLQQEFGFYTQVKGLANIQDAGTEQLNGEETTKYVADVSDLAEFGLEDIDVESARFTGWVNADNQLVKMVIDLEIDGQMHEFSMSFSQFAPAADIQAPTSAQAVSA